MISSPTESAPPLQTQAIVGEGWRQEPPTEEPPTGSQSSALLAEWEKLRADRGQEGEVFPAIFLEIKEIKDPFRRRAFRGALLAEWAASDPHAALAFLQQNDKGLTSQFVREWFRQNPREALQALLEGGQKYQSVLRGLLSEVARVTPEQLPGIVAGLPKSDNRWDTSIRDAFAILSKSDRAGAIAAAQSVNGPLRGQALAGVAQAWAELDGPGALAWAQSLDEGDDRDMTLKAALTGWAKAEPLRALDHLDAAPPGGEEGYYASDTGAQLLREAASKNWGETMQWLRTHPGKVGRSSLDGLQDVLSKRLNTDPAGALQELARSGIPELDHVLGNSLLNDGYAKKDAIWEWLDQQPPDDFTRATRGWLLNAMGWKEPEVALSYLEKLPPTEENRAMLEQGVRSLINGGSQMNRFEDLLRKTSASIRPLLLEAGFQNGFQNTIANPVQWIQRLDEIPPDRRSNAVSGLARSWAVSDPEGAIRWSRSLSDPSQRTSALMSATSAWAGSDVHEAAHWVKSLPKGDDRDVAVTSLTFVLATNEPEAAWEWALTIENPQQRQNALQGAYMALQKKDPSVAKEFLRSANLRSPEAQALERGRQ